MREDTYTPEADKPCHDCLYHIHIRLEVGDESDHHESYSPEDIDDRVISNLERVEEEEDI